LLRLVWAYVPTTPDADDLFQEIAIALWKALPNFRQDCSERTYVCRVAHNTAISFVTSTKRRTQREKEPEEHEQEEPISSMNPEREACLRRRICPKNRGSSCSAGISPSV
jgi:RNA polymerase sigma-70 factor, ECF subfamily